MRNPQVGREACACRVIQTFPTRLCASKYCDRAVRVANEEGGKGAFGWDWTREAKATPWSVNKKEQTYPPVPKLELRFRKFNSLRESSNNCNVSVMSRPVIRSVTNSLAICISMATPGQTKHLSRTNPTLCHEGRKSRWENRKSQTTQRHVFADASLPVACQIRSRLRFSKDTRIAKTQPPILFSYPHVATTPHW